MDADADPQYEVLYADPQYDVLYADPQYDVLYTRIHITGMNGQILMRAIVTL